MKNRIWRVAALVCLSLPALATETNNAAELTLESITVVAAGVSNMTAASAGDISQSQIAGQPVLRPAAILENVPGLVVTQHSGEGKANQYFLRAFNLDHGSDLALEVDDMPVNMPSHAHGQGYADFNFVIPELVEDLHYKKGPYYADEGDFATAGSVRVGLISEAPASAALGYGEDGYRRELLIGSTQLAGGTLLGAGEIYHNDGPFEVPDDYRRLNGVLRYHRGDPQDYYSITTMLYSGNWNATDQVPQRAIDAGITDRFGSLNPSDGGHSSRYSLSFNRVTRTAEDQLQLSAYVIRYRLDLWSTFTFYLSDPVNGDQMLQHDDRGVYGFKVSKSWFGSLFGLPSTSLLGVQARIDDIRDVGIFHTVERRVIGVDQDAGVVEAAGALYAENTLEWLPHLHTTLGLRVDQFNFDVKDKLFNRDGTCNIASDPLGCNTGNKGAAIVSPKLGAVWEPWSRSTLFLNLGDGFHSNDARGVTRSGQNPDSAPVTPLTRATGMELGIATQWVPNLDSRLDVFQLKLRSELVFDGDAGATSPSGATTRRGVEWANSYHVNSWLTAEFNAAFTRARFDRDAAPDDLGCGAAAASHPCAQPVAIVGRYVPNSPNNVMEAALIAERDAGWFGSLRARHFGESSLDEDNNARSPAYTTVDAQIGFRAGRQWMAALDVFNIADVRWNDIEYYYVSRLRNEASPSADYVVHPGVPRTLRARIQYQF